MINKGYLKKFLLLVIMVFTLLIPLNVFAGDGNGNSGSFQLESSDPSDGSSNIEEITSIKLNFNKNVVNMSVKENNLNCFSLKTSEGKEVIIDVKMADDQIEPDKKREIVIQPKETLEKDKEYVLTISKDLKAKNGNTLGENVEITFDTGKQKSINVYGYVIGGLVIVLVLGVYITMKKTKK